MPPSLFITGYYGFENTGDETILAAMLADLRALLPAAHIAVCSGKPDETAARHGVKAVYCYDALAMLEAARGADLVLIGGGGIFHDYWGFNPDGFLTDRHWGISYYTAPAVLAALYAKPLMLYAVGAGPLVSEHGRRFTRLACDIAAAITVRDEGSKTLLESIGVAPGKVRVTADPAFALPLPGAERLLPGNARLPVAGIVARHWDIGVHPSFWERELAAALDLFVEREGGSLVFVPFQTLAGEQHDDPAVAARIRSHMKRQDAALLLDRPLSPQERFALLGQCDLVLGMRLHATIAAILHGTPFVALSYDAKVDQLVRRTGLEYFALDIKSIDASLLARRLREALARREELRPTLLHAREQLTNLAHENARIALCLLDPQAARPALFSPEMAEALQRALQAHLHDARQRQAESRQLQAENKRLFDEVAFYLNSSRQLEQQAAGLEQRVSQLTAETARQAAELARRQAEFDAARAVLEADLAAARAARAALEDQLARAERQRLKLLEGLDRFHHAFNKEREVYRSQRAWRVMLFLRKAYTLLLCRGWRGRLRFFPWLFSGAPGLEEQELRFPDIWNYVPEELHTPFRPCAPAAGATQPPARVPAPRGRYDLIVLPIFDYEFRFQRPQQIAAQFARDGHRVFWVSPAGMLPPGSPKKYDAVPLRENLWKIHLPGEPQQLYTGELTPEKARFLEDCLAELYRDFAIAESAVLLQFPYWRRLGLELRQAFDARILYDCMDDWTAWKTEPLINQFNLEEERRLALEADALIVTAKALAEKFTPLGARPVLVPNAADFPFFSSPRSNPLLADIPRPIVGYYGAIANWLDLDLLYEVARSRPQYSFVLIGCVYSEKAAPLRELPNVTFTGERTYREMPLYLSWFDACIIPFLLDELTQAVDPVKMYEYFSQGKPVVATAMAELAQAAGLLYIAADPEDFARKLDLALAEPPDDPRRRRRIEFAAANTWAARVKTIDGAITPSFPLVSILIVTYNCREFLDACFDSIRRHTSWPSYEIVVVDNHSTDGTRERMEQLAAQDPRIRLTCLDRNAGFAAGNNVAARQARGEYFVFLNPDTCVTPGWIGRLIRHCRRDPSIGLVGAVTNFAGNEVKINVDYRNAAEMEQFALQRARDKMGVCFETAVLPLFCVLAPRTVWEKAGELDEGFQIGMFEDDDFCLRVRQAGFRVVAAEDCFIHHFGSGSFAKLPSEESLRIFEQNRQRYEAKWRTRWQEHKLRPGIRPPLEEPRFTPEEFVRAEAAAQDDRPPVMRLRGIHPTGTRAGRHFHLQPNGQSALAADCENALPSSIILFNNVPLATNYGGPNLLTAWVPPKLYAQPGRYPVYLANDFGESNRLEFLVE